MGKEGTWAGSWAGLVGGRGLTEGRVLALNRKRHGSCQSCLNTNHRKATLIIKIVIINLNNNNRHHFKGKDM